MAEFKISGIWKDSNNVITHYAIHIVDNESNFDYHNNKGQEVRIREMSSLNKAKFEAPKIEFEKIKISGLNTLLQKLHIKITQFALLTILG